MYPQAYEIERFDTPQTRAGDHVMMNTIIQMQLIRVASRNICGARDNYFEMEDVEILKFENYSKFSLIGRILRQALIKKKYYQQRKLSKHHTQKKLSIELSIQ